MRRRIPARRWSPHGCWGCCPSAGQGRLREAGRTRSGGPRLPLAHPIRHTDAGRTRGAPSEWWARRRWLSSCQSRRDLNVALLAPLQTPDQREERLQLLLDRHWRCVLHFFTAISFTSILCPSSVALFVSGKDPFLRKPSTLLLSLLGLQRPPAGEPSRAPAFTSPASGVVAARDARLGPRRRRPRHPTARR